MCSTSVTVGPLQTRILSTVDLRMRRCGITSRGILRLASCVLRRPAAVRIDRIGRVFPLGAFVDDARPSPSKFTIMAAACKPNRCRRFSEACGQDHGDGNVGNSLLWRAESTVIPRRSHTCGHKLEFDFDVCTVIGSLRSLRPPCGVLFDRQLWGPQKPKVRKIRPRRVKFCNSRNPCKRHLQRPASSINPFRALDSQSPGLQRKLRNNAMGHNGRNQ